MRNEILDEMEEFQTYQKHEVVWAKILGWPWWPAKISQIPDEKNKNYRVEFLGDTSHAFLPQDKLMDYEDARERHSTPKGHFRNFGKALALADKLLQSSSALKEESRTDFTWNKKLPTPQIQLINSQNIQKNQRTDNQQRSEIEQASNQPIEDQLHLHQPKIGKIRSEERLKMMMKKKQSKQVLEQVQTLLKQYKLEDLEYSIRGNRFPKKRKMISKESVCQSYENSFQIESKLARTISKALSSKGIKQTQKFIIANSLMNIFFAHKEKDVSGLHRALFQWIRCNDIETIRENHNSWPNDNKPQHCTDCF